MNTEHVPSEGLNAAVARTLNGERAASKVSFDKLAETTGISKRTLLRLLSTMERDLDVSVIDRIARALGLTVLDVFTMAEQRIEREARQDDGTVRGA